MNSLSLSLMWCHSHYCQLIVVCSSTQVPQQFQAVQKHLRQQLLGGVIRVTNLLQVLDDIQHHLFDQVDMCTGGWTPESWWELKTNKQYLKQNLSLPGFFVYRQLNQFT